MGLLTSIAAHPIGAGQRQIIQTYDAGVQPTTGAITANSVYVARVRPLDWITITQLHVHVETTAVGNIDVAVLDIDTMERLAGPAAPATIVGSGLLQSFTLVAPFTMSPYRDYDLAVGSDAAPVLARVTGRATINGVSTRGRRKANEYSSGIPNPLSGAPTADAVMVWIAGT